MLALDALNVASAPVATVIELHAADADATAPTVNVPPTPPAVGRLAVTADVLGEMHPCAIAVERATVRGVSVVDPLPHAASPNARTRAIATCWPERCGCCFIL
jgi:hypothetical protein